MYFLILLEVRKPDWNVNKRVWKTNENHLSIINYDYLFFTVAQKLLFKQIPNNDYCYNYWRADIYLFKGRQLALSVSMQTKLFIKWSILSHVFHYDFCFRAAPIGDDNYLLASRINVDSTMLRRCISNDPHCPWRLCNVH